MQVGAIHKRLSIFGQTAIWADRYVGGAWSCRSGYDCDGHGSQGFGNAVDSEHYDRVWTDWCGQGTTPHLTS